MRGLLLLALPFNLGGLISPSSLLGGLITLVAWQLVSDDLERIEREDLDASYAPMLEQLRRWCIAALGFCALTYAWQGWALRTWGIQGWLSLWAELLGQS